MLEQRVILQKSTVHPKLAASFEMATTRVVEVSRSAVTFLPNKDRGRIVNPDFYRAVFAPGVTAS